MSPALRYSLERFSLRLFGHSEYQNAETTDLFANYSYDSILEEGMERIKESKSFSEYHIIAPNHAWQVNGSHSTDGLAKKLREAKSMDGMEKIYEDNRSHSDRTDMAGYIEEIKNQFEKAMFEL